MADVEFEHVLRRHQMRVTRQRLVILEALAGLGGHPSVRQVYQVARGRLAGLNLATVYRALEALQQAGLVDVFTAPAGVQRFAYHDPAHPHAHLLCLGCLQLHELTPVSLAPLAEHILEQSGFRVDLSHLTLTGMCASCCDGGKQGSPS